MRATVLDNAHPPLGPKTSSIVALYSYGVLTGPAGLATMSVWVISSGRHVWGCLVDASAAPAA